MLEIVSVEELQVIDPLECSRVGNLQVILPVIDQHSDTPLQHGLNSNSIVIISYYLMEVLIMNSCSRLS
jgi:hypothetical protein